MTLSEHYFIFVLVIALICFPLLFISRANRELQKGVIDFAFRSISGQKRDFQSSSTTFAGRDKRDKDERRLSDENTPLSSSRYSSNSSTPSNQECKWMWVILALLSVYLLLQKNQGT